MSLYLAFRRKEQYNTSSFYFCRFINGCDIGKLLCKIVKDILCL